MKCDKHPHAVFVNPSSVEFESGGGEKSFSAIAAGWILPACGSVLSAGGFAPRIPKNGPLWIASAHRDVVDADAVGELRVEHRDHVAPGRRRPTYRPTPLSFAVRETTWQE